MSNKVVELQQYYIEFRDFKYYFIQKWMTSSMTPSINRYEIYKVWAHWLIRNLCKMGDHYHLIPSPQTIINDNDILNHLKEKGCGDIVKIFQFYGQIVERISYLYQKYNQLKVDQINDVNQIMETNKLIKYETMNKYGKQYHIYRYGSIYVKYTDYSHGKLIIRYIGDMRCFRFYMFEMGFNYYMLEGCSFQWCVPPKALNTLKNILFVETELFASPINVSLTNYYSLFNVDQYFGALGNFFNMEHDDIMEGTFEVNPPFIEYIFVRSSNIIINLLKNRQQQNKDLLFIYIMPNWLDSGGYQMLVNSGYLLDEIILTEKNHFYHQSSKYMMISANFETHVLIIGTDLSRKRWTQEVKYQFINNFTHF